MERIVSLAPATWAALQQVAAQEDQTIGQIIRDAVDRELSRRATARKVVRPDERLIAPLRALLAGDLAHATGWGDLDSRLAIKGYRLVESGGGLALVAVEGGAKVCKASDLGFSLARLTARLGPCPGHGHARAAARFALAQGRG